MVERKNIESMIVNSKLWSPSVGLPHQNFSLSGGLGDIGGESISSATGRSVQLNETITSNVFRDKREELTKILKKRLNYIH